MRDFASEQLTREAMRLWRELENQSTDVICSVQTAKIRGHLAAYKRNARALRRAGVLRQIGYIRGTIYFRLERRIDDRSTDRRQK